MSIKKITINTSIAVLVLIIVFVLYKIMFSGGDEEAPTTGGVVPQGFLASEDKNAGAAEFLDVLLSVQNISFDNSVFNRGDFQSLRDFSVNLVAKPTGRVNPFAPLGVGNIEKTQEEEPPTDEITADDGTDDVGGGFEDIEDFEDFDDLEDTF